MRAGSILAARKLSCALWGHRVDGGVCGEPDIGRRCRCGASHLHTDGRTTHVRHTLKCFLSHHTYS